MWVGGHFGLNGHFLDFLVDSGSEIFGATIALTKTQLQRNYTKGTDFSEQETCATAFREAEGRTHIQVTLWRFGLG